MGWLSQVGSLLQQYSGKADENAPASVNEDFNQVSKVVPRQDLAGALSHAFNSDQTPPFANMVGSLFGQSSGQEKAGLLNQLLSKVPALSGLLGGAQQVTPEQAEQISPDAVQQAAQHAQQQNPSIVDEVSSFYAQHPTLVQGLGAGALALMLKRMANR
jgi:hypothetical protein